MQVAVEDDIHTVLIQQCLHGLPHALILQVVSGVCSNMQLSTASFAMQQNLS